MIFPTSVGGETDLLSSDTGGVGAAVEVITPTGIFPFTVVKLDSELVVGTDGGADEEQWSLLLVVVVLGISFPATVALDVLVEVAVILRRWSRAWAMVLT